MLRSYATHHQLIIQHALEATERINYFTAPAQDPTEKKETSLPPHFQNNPDRKKVQTHPGFATSFHKDSLGKRFIRCATVPPAGLLLRVAALTAVTRLMKSWPVGWQWLIWGGGERENMLLPIHQPIGTCTPHLRRRHCARPPPSARRTNSRNAETVPRRRDRRLDITTFAASHHQLHTHARARAHAHAHAHTQEGKKKKKEEE
jgi:hypothetical protein